MAVPGGVGVVGVGGMDGPSSPAPKKPAPGIAKKTNGSKPLQPGQEGSPGAVELGKEGVPANPAWAFEKAQLVQENQALRAQAARVDTEAQERQRAADWGQCYEGIYQR